MKANVFKRRLDACLCGNLGDTMISSISPCEHKNIKRCLDFIWKNYSKPIQLKDLVKVSKMSRRGFVKAFIKYVGVNPGTFLRSLRIERAKQLLVEQDLKLWEIAPRCGYRSVNSFAVAFMREVKLPPKGFQRQYWLATVRRSRLVESRLTNSISSLVTKSRRFAQSESLLTQ